ncbi:MAG: hypothetical protein DMD83_18270 [Candidatus Rokuibacteriota bacterium]|nr:MAG: hypothetical protein DMD83_18270 [Candidatus Rokubacteria bacterium]
MGEDEQAGDPERAADGEGPGRPGGLRSRARASRVGPATARFTLRRPVPVVTATKELLNLVDERLTAPAPAVDSDNNLTRRELEILRLVAGGSDTKAVAERLNVSPATVRNHVQNVLGKLGAHSRLQAVAYATTVAVWSRQA